VKPRQNASTSRGHPGFALEQARGLKAPAIRQDSARSEIVRTAGGLEILLAVISAGRPDTHGGQAAGLVLEHVFRAVTVHDGRNVIGALRDGIQAGARALATRSDRWGADTVVNVAAVAVLHGRIYFASAGELALFFVSDGRCTRLGAAGTPPLRPSGPASIQAGPKEGLRLGPEDQLVLASSGLLALSPEDRRPYVDAKDIPGYVSGNPPMEAARHLISIALGRDIVDDVSIIVLQAPGRRRSRKLLLTVVLGLTAILSVIVFGALAVNLLTPTIPAQPGADYGYAVLVEGDILMETSEASQSGPVRVRRLETIPAGSRILAQVDSRLGIQTTHEGPSELPALAIYLSAGSIVQLTNLDPREGEPAPDQPAERTVITLESGALLLKRDGGSRWTQVRSGGIIASFSPPGAGALAVVSDPSRILIQCLAGGCVLQIGGAAPVFIEAPGQAEVHDGALGEVRSLSSAEVSAWNELCGDCIEFVP